MEHIFISHSSEDDSFVKELREKLVAHGLSVWVDSRNLRGGDRLGTEIEKAIEDAGQVIVVLGRGTVNSPWVRKEVEKALEVERSKKDSGYRVIPVLLPGMKPSSLGNWFDEEPIAVTVQLRTGGVTEALPRILAALGERLPDDVHPAPEPPSLAVGELKLKLGNPRLEQVGEGKQRAQATAQLIYDPADSTRPTAESREFSFSSPLGPIEADHLRWYLEEYYRWPTTFFAERAKRIEDQLPKWGRMLYEAAVAAESARSLLAAWTQEADGIERRFSIFVDSRLPEGSSDSEQEAAAEAASALLAIPWELLHDGQSFLFQGRNAVRVRRCLPKERAEKPSASKLPIRILLVSPRPEDDRAGYIDHRISARPLVEAIETLGELAELTVLDPPTYLALQTALRKAGEAGVAFDVIHFDGHGVYDKQRGLGALCFEDPKDLDKLEHRASISIDAEKLGELVRQYRIPLVFLEACQSASEERPSASVAAKLLDAGVTSVVAMTHSVLVETARRFVTAFYSRLAEGSRVGSAMLAGQEALYTDDFRFHVMGAGELRLKDWFVPVLYQEENDARLVTRLVAEEIQGLMEQRRKLSLGELPEPPAHSFVGRSRDLLKLERMLADTRLRYAVIRGRGGEGKTTLAVELARWMVKTNRFDRAAFVSLEEYSDARGVLDSIGRQLLPDGASWSVAQFNSVKEAQLQVDRALRDHRTIIVLDNMESVLPSPAGGAASRVECGSSPPLSSGADLSAPGGCASGEVEGAASGKAEPYHTSERQSREEGSIVAAQDGAVDGRADESARGQSGDESPHSQKPPEKYEARDRKGSELKVEDTAINELFELCEALLDAARSTRLVFTSREGMPEPFDHSRRTAILGELDPGDAIELVSEVMKQEGMEPKRDDAGNTPKEVEDLVEAVGRHARALILLAREIAIQGVSATTDNVRKLMAELDRKHPGDRENSLYASVELSLRRLPTEIRERVKALGVFHGGANLVTLMEVLDVDQQSALNIGRALVEVGLAEEMPYGHLRFDPALPGYVRDGLSQQDLQAARSRWVRAMTRLTVTLYKQQFEDSELAARLTSWDLPNIMAMLQWAERHGDPETMIELAVRVECLLANLAIPRALAATTRSRVRAVGRLDRGVDWSHVHFLNEYADVERALEGGAARLARERAVNLVQRCLAISPALAYPGSDYDLALAYIVQGRVLRECGECEEALKSLDEARRRFKALAEVGDEDAAGMASKAVAEAASALTQLGQLRESEVAYEEAIRGLERAGDRRSVASTTANLGALLLRRGNYSKALDVYRHARAAFERLGEPRNIAVIMHQVARVHRLVMQFEEAERAYREALAISVREKDLAGEARTLGELGNLYDDLKRFPEAVQCYRAACDIYTKLRDAANEGKVRNNLGATLLKLCSFDAARAELERALECKKPYGASVEPWTTWSMLGELEASLGDLKPAIEARQRAIDSYLSYRRDGGQSYYPGAQTCAAVAQAIQSGDRFGISELARQLVALLEGSSETLPPQAQAFFPKLQAILGGSRDPALADDPELYYTDAVELRLLLESLSTTGES